MEEAKLNTAEFWENRLSANYDEIGVGYSSLGKSFNRWMYKHRLRNLSWALTKEQIDPSGDILDIGSGTGFYINHWLKLGTASSVSGVDITETAVEKLKQKFSRSEFYCGDIGSNDFKLEGKYDLISAFDVLFHIVDDEKYHSAIQNIHTLLKEKGTFVFTENLVPAEKRSTHITFREKAGVLRLLEEKGFDVIMITPVFVLMNEPIGTGNAFLKLWWKIIALKLKWFPFLGNVFGPILYPIEGWLTRNKKQGPSTHLVICRKR